MRARIGLDTRMAFHTGIGRYLRGLLSGLQVSKHFDYHFFGPQPVFSINSKDRFTKVVAPLYGIREQFVIPSVSLDCSCLHIPHYNAPLCWPKKLIVTIHDLIHLHYRNHLSSYAARSYAALMLPVITKRADAIIAVSEYTKEDLIRTLSVDPKKVTVIHHGLDPSFVNGNANGPVGCKSAEPYFLYVGLLKAHKNVGVLLRAFQSVKAQFKDRHLKLRLVGKPDLKQAVVREWVDAIQRDPDIVLESGISDAELRERYRNAICLVFPSLCEGFGFPLLEAMASKIPVLAARSASIPEILGEEAGLYFDPYSESELVTHMKSVITDSSLTDRMIREGENRTRLFEWENAAKKTEEVYAAVVG